METSTQIAKPCGSRKRRINPPQKIVSSEATNTRCLNCNVAIEASNKITTLHIDEDKVDILTMLTTLFARRVDPKTGCYDNKKYALCPDCFLPFIGLYSNALKMKELHSPAAILAEDFCADIISSTDKLTSVPDATDSTQEQVVTVNAARNEGKEKCGPTPLLCKYCRKVYRRIPDEKQAAHLKQCKELSSRKCDICDLSFREKSDVQHHVGQAHATAPHFLSKKCLPSYNFASEGEECSDNDSDCKIIAVLTNIPANKLNVKRSALHIQEDEGENDDDNVSDKDSSDEESVDGREDDDEIDNEVVQPEVVDLSGEKTASDDNDDVRDDQNAVSENGEMAVEYDNEENVEMSEGCDDSVDSQDEESNDDDDDDDWKYEYVLESQDEDEEDILIYSRDEVFVGDIIHPLDDAIPISAVDVSDQAEAFRRLDNENQNSPPILNRFDTINRAPCESNERSGDEEELEQPEEERDLVYNGERRNGFQGINGTYKTSSNCPNNINGLMRKGKSGVNGSTTRRRMTSKSQTKTTISSNSLKKIKLPKSCKKEKVGPGRSKHLKSHRAKVCKRKAAEIENQSKKKIAKKNRSKDSDSEYKYNLSSTANRESLAARDREPRLRKPAKYTFDSDESSDI